MCLHQNLYYCAQNFTLSVNCFNLTFVIHEENKNRFVIGILIYLNKMWRRNLC